VCPEEESWIGTSERPEEVFGAEEELIRVDEQDRAEMREGQLGQVIGLLIV
jgi:hypothetical protein